MGTVCFQKIFPPWKAPSEASIQENDIPIAGAAPPPTYSAATGAPAQQPQIIYVQQGAPPPPQQEWFQRKTDLIFANFSWSQNKVLVVDPYGNPAGIQTRHCNSCQSSVKKNNIQMYIQSYINNTSAYIFKFSSATSSLPPGLHSRNDPLLHIFPDLWLDHVLPKYGCRRSLLCPMRSESLLKNCQYWNVCNWK